MVILYRWHFWSVFEPIDSFDFTKISCCHWFPMERPSFRLLVYESIFLSSKCWMAWAWGWSTWFCWSWKRPQMDEAAKKLHNDLSTFANKLSGEHHVLKESLSKAAQELAEAFNVQPTASVGKIASVRKMQVQRAYYKKKCQSLEKQLKDASGVKSHGAKDTFICKSAHIFLYRPYMIYMIYIYIIHIIHIAHIIHIVHIIHIN